MSHDMNNLLVGIELVTAVKNPGQVVILSLIHKSFYGVWRILPGLDAKPQFWGRFNQPGVMLFPEPLGQMTNLKRGQDGQAMPDLKSKPVPPGLALFIGRDQPFRVEHI